MKISNIQHGLYSKMISANGINILFDLRINNNLARNKSEILIYCQYPEKLIKKGAQMLNSETQKITAKTAKECRSLFFNNIIQYL